MNHDKPLPEGTVTLLFTDIEGSTRLLQHLGARYAEVLEEHRSLLSTAFRQWGGRELGTEGDSVAVAFHRATDAVAAASAGQRALASHAWPEGSVVRVRMGLHTGEPALTPGGYVGIDVHRAARIGAAGHGGQILLSQTTRDLVEHDLPPGASLRDLGAHRLKDLPRPEQVFELVLADLPSDFPPLKSLDARPNNLPLQLTSFVGREREIAEVSRLLGTTRLLTLTGAGGCGKTRLSLQVAAELLEDYSDGVWLVELAALTDASLVAQTVATSLGLREETGRPLTETLADSLRPRHQLVLLDNCEHLVAACAALADALLRACPDLRILATSREPLSIAGETVWRVPSLSLPDPQRPSPAQSLTQYEAVRLFIERALASQPAFAVTNANAPAVAEVCHRLDGIPLAIELAAARVRLLSVEQIAARLDDRFRLLTGGSRTALPRHQTLQAAMDWSYDLLSEAERFLLRRLSVFVGGWPLPAAEAVCAGDGIDAVDVLDLLGQLVDKSLVAMEDQGGEARYRLLETIRQYAGETLQRAGEDGLFRERHRDWYLALAEQAEPALQGPGQGRWLDRLDREHDNLRAALEWSAERGEAEAGLRLGGVLWRFWSDRGYLGEGRARLAEILKPPGASGRSRIRAKAVNGAGMLAFRQGDFEAARALYEESLAIWRELGDKSGIALSLSSLGLLAENQGDYPTAWALHEGSLAIRRELGDKWGIATSLGNLGIIAENRGNHTTAQALHEECLAIKRELGDKSGIAYALGNLGLVAENQGDYSAARALYQECLAILRELGNKWGIPRTLNNLGNLANYQGDYPTARALHEESLAIRRELGDRYGIASSLCNLGCIAESQGDYPTAWALNEGCLAIVRELGDKRGIALSLGNLGNIAGHQGNHTTAQALHEESLTIKRELGNQQGIATSLNSLGDVALNQGDYPTAQALHEESLAIQRELGDKLGIAENVRRLAAVAGAQGKLERAARLFGAAGALRDTLGAPLEPIHRAANEHQMAAVRASLGEEAFAAAWAQGQAMTSEQAVCVALEESEIPTTGRQGS